MTADLEVQGLSKAVVAQLCHGISDEQSLTYHLDTLKNLTVLGIPHDSASIAPSLLAAINPRMKAPFAIKLFGALETASKNPKAAEALGKLDGIDKVGGF